MYILWLRFLYTLQISRYTIEQISPRRVVPCSLLRVLTRRGTEDATSKLIDRFFQQQQFGPGEDPQPINYLRRGADRRIQPSAAGCRWIMKPGEPAEGPQGSGTRD